MPVLQLTLLVLDVSSSMGDKVLNTPNGTTKAWQIEEDICRPLMGHWEAVNDRRDLILPQNCGLIARLQHSQRKDNTDLGIILFGKSAELYQEVKPITEWKLSPPGTKLNPPTSASDSRYLLGGKPFDLMSYQQKGTDVAAGLRKAHEIASEYIEYWQKKGNHYEPFVNVIIMSDFRHNQSNINEVLKMLREIKNGERLRGRQQSSYTGLAFGDDANVKFVEQLADSYQQTRKHSGIFPSGTLFGNYIIDESIGHGGIGTVYKARHKTLNYYAAVKVHEYFPQDELVGIAFLQSANYLSQLNHPNIVRLYDYGFQHKRAYMVMELIEGQTLARLIPKVPTENWTKQSIDFFIQILSAIRYSHSCSYLDSSGQEIDGILHGDIKPQNILVTKDKLAKITDFMSPDVQVFVGKQQLPFFELREIMSSLLIRHHVAFDTRMLFLSSLSVGTPGYMPNEQWNGLVTQQTDIFGLGATFYEILTNRSPIYFTLDKLRPKQVNPFVPQWMDDLIVKAMSEEPSERYASVAEMESVFYNNLQNEKHSANLSVKEWIMGDKLEIKTGQISGNRGQLFIGKFNDVVANLNTAGKTEFAENLKILKEAVMASTKISDEKKQEHIEVINQIGEEATKPSPNKTLLAILSEGLLTALKAIPDIAKTIATIAPFLTSMK